MNKNISSINFAIQIMCKKQVICIHIKIKQESMQNQNKYIISE